MSDETPSPAAPEAPAAASAGAEAPAAPSAAAMPVEVPRPCWCGAAVADGRCTVDADHPLCSCRARPHADRPGFCANNHPFKGHGGKLSFKHGLYAQQPIDSDGAVMASASGHRYEALCRVFAMFEPQMLRFATHLRPNRLRDLRQASSMFAEMRTVHAELSAMESTETPEQTWARCARVFIQRADDFVALVSQVLAERPELAPTLRAALAAHDAKQPQAEQGPVSARPPVAVGKPRVRSGDDDEIVL